MIFHCSRGVVIQSVPDQGSSGMVADSYLLVFSGLFLFFSFLFDETYYALVKSQQVRISVSFTRSLSPHIPLEMFLF